MGVPVDFYGLKETLRRITGFGKNKVLMTDSTSGDPKWAAQSGIDHGSLGGLSDDDHTQYLLVSGLRDAETSGTFSQEFKSTGADTAAALQLTGRRSSADKRWTITSLGGSNSPNDALIFDNPSATLTALTISDAGGISVNALVDPGAGVINANTGYRVGNAAASGNYLRGNGTNFVSSAIQTADLPTLPTHGASVHDNRTRSLWLPAGNTWITILGAPDFALRNSLYGAWAFDQTSVEVVSQTIQLPYDCVSVDSVTIVWSDSAGATGNVVWRIGFGNGGDGYTYALTTTDTSATAAPAAHVLKHTNLTKAMPNSISAGTQTALVSVGRITTDAGDDYAADAFLVGLMINYTADM